MKDNYDQIWDGEWNFLPKEMNLACCDCGLIHKIKIRVKNNEPQIMFLRDNRRTSLRRRFHGVSIELVRWWLKNVKRKGKNK
jgi:hypothetical protein